MEDKTKKTFDTILGYYSSKGEVGRKEATRQKTGVNNFSNALKRHQ
jgi:hypothetical protein